MESQTWASELWIHKKRVDSVVESGNDNIINECEMWKHIFYKFLLWKHAKNDINVIGCHEATYTETIYILLLSIVDSFYVPRASQQPKRFSDFVHLFIVHSSQSFYFSFFLFQLTGSKTTKSSTRDTFRIKKTKITNKTKFRQKWSFHFRCPVAEPVWHYSQN